MATPIRSAAADPKAAASSRRRLRRRRGCRRLIAAVAFIATVAAFAFVVPLDPAVRSAAFVSGSSFFRHSRASLPSPPLPNLSNYTSPAPVTNFSNSSALVRITDSTKKVAQPVKKKEEIIRKKSFFVLCLPRMIQLGLDLGETLWLRPYWLLSPDEALVYAKREIENAPLVTEEPDFYAPIYRNVSAFKRSYELMEKILKVYIYNDGQRPIFHTPELQGIYASEGWFMKLIEESKVFVVKDPRKAHLFYLPYSSRQLKEALYLPGSHNLRPLGIYLKDYVNSLASKYPFWNRTKGADHFLVACHDWGPYTTKFHDELCKNTIKALCNADTSEGIFIRGRDVSLPETTIKFPKKPLRYVGGKKHLAERIFLAFYAGNMHGRVRPLLQKYWGDKYEDMKIYRRLPNRVSRNMSYIEHMKSSRFCICPMGYEVNSPRIVEAIYSECVPVIIADNFVLPFDEVLNWSSFSVVIPEKDIPNLRDILLGISLRRYISLQTGVKHLQRHFLWHDIPEKYDLFHMILHSIWFNRLKQIQS